jgi:hypothetical protein
MAGLRIGGLAVLCAMLGAHASLAQTSQVSAESAGSAVSVKAQVLKGTDDIVFSAQELRPISLEGLSAPIDLSTLGAGDARGLAVSEAARGLRYLDPAEIPGTARTLGGIARGDLPGAAGSRSAGAGMPSLPSAAQNRGRGGR